MRVVAFDAGDSRDIRARGGAELGVVDVGAEGFAAVLELMNVGLECLLHAGDVAAGAYGEAVLVGGDDGESMAL